MLDLVYLDDVVVCIIGNNATTQYGKGSMGGSVVG